MVDAIKHETKSRARKKGTKNAAAAAAKNPADAVDTNESPSPVRPGSNNDEGLSGVPSKQSLSPLQSPSPNRRKNSNMTKYSSIQFKDETKPRFRKEDLKTIL